MARPGRHSSTADGLRRLADYAGFSLLWCWILVSLFAVPTWLGYWWLGALLFVLGLVVCWQAAEASHDPVTTIGTKRDVRTGTVETAGIDCDECDRPAGGGEYRRYEQRRVLFGTTVAVLESGENVYCSDCLDVPRERVEHAGGASAGADESPDEVDLESERS